MAEWCAQARHSDSAFPADAVRTPRYRRHRKGRSRSIQTLQRAAPFKSGSCSNRDSDSARGRLSHFSTAHHGLTTQVPHSVDIALPSHAQIPKIDGVPLQVFWYPEPSLSAGVDVVTVDKVPVRIYSPEKTIADCFKYRNKIGLDVAIEALRTYRARRRRPDFQSLAKFAQINRVQRVMRLTCPIFCASPTESISRREAPQIFRFLETRGRSRTGAGRAGIERDQRRGRKIAQRG